MQHWLGGGMAAAFLVLVIFSIFALDIVGLAATGRLVFAMGRDNILPASGFLRRVNPRTRMPIRALSAASGLSILFTLWGYVIQRTGQGQSAFFALVTATASLPFIVYLLTVVAYVIPAPPLRAAGRVQPRDLGPARHVPALGWTILVLLLLTIPSPFWSADIVIAVVLVVASAWYFAVLRRRLARGQAGVRALPEIPNLATEDDLR